MNQQEKGTKPARIISVCI